MLGPLILLFHSRNQGTTATYALDAIRLIHADRCQRPCKRKEGRQGNLEGLVGRSGRGKSRVLDAHEFIT